MLNEVNTHYDVDCIWKIVGEIFLYFFQSFMKFQSEKLDVHRNQFWQAVWIWHQRPHIVNRRLFGMKTLNFFRTSNSVNFEEIVLKLNKFSYDDVKSTSFDDDFVAKMIPVQLECCSEDEMLRISDKSFFTARKLLNKNRNYSETFEISVTSK